MSADENEIQLDFCVRSAKLVGYNILMVYPDGIEAVYYGWNPANFLCWKQYIADTLQPTFPTIRFIICKVMKCGDKGYALPLKYIPLTELELLKYK